ncbi:MAG: hypothetical protein JNM28_08945 [Armatimonadetes bacterium]|nr:hypothetical protein [Armatimonadota bacterium]MBS1710812.1 hypothetical protein [Armatimonadota bacterium]MBX3108484.1 hypothetical protein [Fimbriimonadaceae bacterium]
MAALAQAWSETLPEIMNRVTGVGVWTALKSSVPVALEDDSLVLGVPSSDSELIGHLKLPQVRNAVESLMGHRLNMRVNLVVINGTAEADWETEKRRQMERRKLQDQALARQKAEVAAGKSWDTVYDQLSRAYSALPNRSLPQNRAKYFNEAVEIVAQSLLDTPINDDLAERNYARCLERIAQYTELPSTFVALRVLDRSFTG